MELEPTELDELAAFFARRSDVALPATAVPGPYSSMESQWRESLERWQRMGQLSARLHRLRRDHPDDHMLQQVTSVVLDPGRTQERWVGVLFLATGAAAMAAGLLVSLVGGLAYTLVQPEAVVAPIAMTASVIPDASVGRSVAVSRREKRAVTRCRNPSGRVGYWYAGDVSPGSPGDRVMLDRFVNVRVDYPRAGNQWRTDARIACVLRPGDVVDLSERPVRVEGGRFWVPLADAALTPATDVVADVLHSSSRG